MPDPSHAADSGIVGTVATWLGGGFLGIAVLWRALVFFGQQDRTVKVLNEMVQQLRDQLEQSQLDIAAMAHQRNEAVQIRLMLETQLAAEKERRIETAGQRDEARVALARLQVDVERLTAANHRLDEAARLAEAMEGRS